MVIFKPSVQSLCDTGKVYPFLQCNELNRSYQNINRPITDQVYNKGVWRDNFSSSLANPAIRKTDHISLDVKDTMTEFAAK